MRRIIAHLVRGEAKDYSEALTRELTEKFDTFPIHNRIPPHLTLKRQFELSDTDMRKLHSLLDTFSETHTQSDYTMNQFGNFIEDIIFIDVEPSAAMQKDVYELMDTLHTHPNLNFDRYDNGTDFHTNVASKFLKPFDYTTIQNYLKTVDQPNFVRKFDNIAVLQRLEDRWVVEKIWELKT